MQARPASSPASADDRWGAATAAALAPPLQSSDREQYVARYSTQEAAVPLPALPEQQEASEAGLGGGGSGELTGGTGSAELSGLQLHDNPSFLAGSSLADSFDAEAAATARELAEKQQQQQQQQQQHGAEAAAAQQAAAAPARAGAELAGEASGGSLASAAGAGPWQAPEPVGLILLHPGALVLCCSVRLTTCRRCCRRWCSTRRALAAPAPLEVTPLVQEPDKRTCRRAADDPPSLADLSGDVAPKYARVLAHSRLGRRVLRQLLRAELGEVRPTGGQPQARLAGWEPAASSPTALLALRLSCARPCWALQEQQQPACPPPLRR